MRRRVAAWLAWALCGLCSLSAVFSLVVRLRAPGAAPDGWTLANTILNAAFAVVFSLVGAVIVGRQPRNTMGWLLMVIALSFAVPDFGGRASTEPTLANLLIAWYSGWSWWLLVGPLLLILLLFPTGRPPSPRWRWVIVSLAVCFVIFLAFTTFARSFEAPDGVGSLPNPIGVFSNELWPVLLLPWGILLFSQVVLCVSAVFVRYRRAGPVEQEQIKWLLLAAAGLLVGFAMGLLFHSFLPGPSGVLFDLAILSVPLAIGVAIVRYRLWDIDIIIRRTLVYALLTGLLALAYFGSVLVLQAIFSALVGQAQSPLVTVLSTLLIAALFVPLRGRVQTVIDRRFFRRKYDAARTLAGFGASLRDETDLEQLSAHLIGVVDETMQPVNAALWLKMDGAMSAELQVKRHDP